MLAIEKGTSKDCPAGGEEPRDGAAGSYYRFGASKYVIARRRNSALEPLRSALPSGDEAVPVFAAEQAAWRYLRSETLEAGWYVRESRDGELASMLMSLCSGVKSVLLDPDPATPTSAGSGTLVDRKGFLDACVGAGVASHLVGGAGCFAAGGFRR